MSRLDDPASKWLLLFGTNLVVTDQKAEGSPATTRQLQTWINIASAQIHDSKCSPEELPVVPGRDEEWLGNRLANQHRLTARLTALSKQGIHATTIFEKTYPKRLIDNLGDDAPPVLFYSGSLELAETGRVVGFVGSRNAEQGSLDATTQLAESCATTKAVVCSGGARGVDREAEEAAIAAGGSMILFPAEGLSHVVRKKRFRNPMTRGKMLCLSSLDPGAGWHVGNAMSRNALIYGMSTVVCVMHSEGRNGGTWNGAIAALRSKNSVVATWKGPGHGPGNIYLEQEGAIPVTAFDINQAIKQMRAHVSAAKPEKESLQVKKQVLLLGRDW